MLRKMCCFVISWVVAFLFVLSNANATSISLLPSSSNINVRDNIDIDIFADIYPVDAIIAFGFDNDLSGTGILTFDGFTRNTLLFDLDPFFGPNDSDGIYGVSEGDFMFGTPVFGIDILLGTLSYKAMGAGNVIVRLGADDLDIWFTEGLIPADPSLPNFMPEIASAQVTIGKVDAPIAPIPEPTTLLLLGAGLIGMIKSKKEKILS